MSHIVVIAFDDPDEAGRVCESLRSVQHAEGKTHVKNENVYDTCFSDEDEKELRRVLSKEI